MLVFKTNMLLHVKVSSWGAGAEGRRAGGMQISVGRAGRRRGLSRCSHYAVVVHFGSNTGQVSHMRDAPHASLNFLHYLNDLRLLGLFITLRMALNEQGCVQIK
jgi:hypothetical protein